MHTTPRHARLRVSMLAAAMSGVLAAPVFAQATADAGVPPPAPEATAGKPDKPPLRVFDTVYVRGARPTSLPSHIPTTMEGITGGEVVDRVNATDAEDALKYLPSLLVRKRYIGDFDHAVLATRASGTGNSARSLVYADGILLSNLLGNGATFTPRWGMVSPDEIERVDVLYGPFSAAYPGNSVGAVVDYVTRMPERFEAHARLGYSLEHFELYRTRDDYPSISASVSLGQRWGRLAGWLSLNRLESDAHPIAFASVPDTSGTIGSGIAVTGAVAGANPRNLPWHLVGATGQTHTDQDQFKLKLAYDLDGDLRLSYVAGVWRNHALRDARSYLLDAIGTPVYAGSVLIDGRRYAIADTAMSQQRAGQLHRMHGLALKRSSGGRWDYQLVASRYEYAVDRVRSPSGALPAARTGGSGRIADSHGTGWSTASAMATWRPADAHVVEFGVQHDRYRLRSSVSSTGDWIGGIAESKVSAFAGSTSLTSGFAQDTWTLSPRWTAMLGARAEHWRARDGRLANATLERSFAPRTQHAISPKAALQYAPGGDWSLKASIGRAVRFPTVSELYQGTLLADAIVNNDPTLKPERSVTSELSYLRDLPLGRLRATVFHERTRDALYAQAASNGAATITTIQNVPFIRTSGMELTTELTGVGSADFDLAASVTFAGSIIEENPAFPASEGRWQPRVPRWRANLVGAWHPGERWSFTGALRYSGRQFNTLDNTDVHGDAYTGTSPFLVADARVRYRFDARWSAALGVDNLTNRTYWNFHPYNQRTWHAELRFDY